MLGRFAPGIRRADGPGQVTGDVRQEYEAPKHDVTPHSNSHCLLPPFCRLHGDLYNSGLFPVPLGAEDNCAATARSLCVVS